MTYCTDSKYHLNNNISSIAASVKCTFVINYNVNNTNENIVKILDTSSLKVFGSGFKTGNIKETDNSNAIKIGRCKIKRMEFKWAYVNARYKYQ